jgi:hypothetical protein
VASVFCTPNQGKKEEYTFASKISCTIIKRKDIHYYIYIRIASLRTNSPLEHGQAKSELVKVLDNQFVNLDRRIEEITGYLQDFFRKQLRSISENNTATPCDYITA